VAGRNGASRVRVVRRGRRRELYVDGTFASCWEPGRTTTGPVWDALALPLLGLPPRRRRRVLVLGLAGGSAARLVRALAPRAAITGVELVLVYLPFNEVFITSVLVALSLFKFVAVIAWFMHLIYDKLLLTLAFGTGMAIATGTFVALGFIMSRNNVDLEAITQF